AIIPLPLKVEAKGGSFIINTETTIESIGDDDIKEVARYLKEMISAASTFDLSVATSGNTTGQKIILEQNDTGSEEGYSLKIIENEVRISAATATGMFHGVQTLRQLLPPGIENKNKAASSWQ